MRVRTFDEYSLDENGMTQSKNSPTYAYSWDCINRSYDCDDYFEVMDLEEAFERSKKYAETYGIGFSIKRGVAKFVSHEEAMDRAVSPTLSDFIEDTIIDALYEEFGECVENYPNLEGFEPFLKEALVVFLKQQGECPCFYVEEIEDWSFEQVSPLELIHKGRKEQPDV